MAMIDIHKCLEWVRENEGLTRVTPIVARVKALWPGAFAITEIKEALVDANAIDGMVESAAALSLGLGGVALQGAGAKISRRGREARARGLLTSSGVGKKFGVPAWAVDAALNAAEWHHAGWEWKETYYYDADYFEPYERALLKVAKQLCKSYKRKRTPERKERIQSRLNHWRALIDNNDTGELPANIQRLIKSEEIIALREYMEFRIRGWQERHDPKVSRKKFAEQIKKRRWRRESSQRREAKAAAAKTKRHEIEVAAKAVAEKRLEEVREVVAGMFLPHRERLLKTLRLRWSRSPQKRSHWRVKAAKLAPMPGWKGASAFGLALAFERAIKEFEGRVCAATQSFERDVAVIADALTQKDREALLWALGRRKGGIKKRKAWKSHADKIFETDLWDNEAFALAMENALKSREGII